MFSYISALFTGSNSGTRHSQQLKVCKVDISSLASGSPPIQPYFIQLSPSKQLHVLRSAVAPESIVKMTNWHTYRSLSIDSKQSCRNCIIVIPCEATISDLTHHDYYSKIKTIALECQTESAKGVVIQLPEDGSDWGTQLEAI
jgi:hypothetical protein